MKILFLTSNVAKVSLAKERLSKYGIDVIHQPYEFIEARSLDLEVVARGKAQQAIDCLNDNFLIEDSGFYIEALKGFPGTFVKLAFDTLGDKRLTSLVKDELNNKAIVKSVLVYGNPKTKELKLFTGLYEGTIAPKPAGKNIRGWKVVRIFIPKGSDKTLAQLNKQQWQSFLDEFREHDHFEKFAQWITKNARTKK